MKKILVVNCGSSTIKFQLIEMEDSKVLAKGRCDMIGYNESNKIGRASCKERV